MIIIELAYSFHLGSDKNKKNSSKASAKSNVSGTTSKSNNAIQNACGLTKVDNHNYRKYDNQQENIEIIRGSSSLVDDVKKLYIEEFEEAKEEYNSKQTRENRKIKDYFTHVSNNSKSDLACEIIIELVNKKYWDTKDLKFKKKMTNVFKEQVVDLPLWTCVAPKGSQSGRHRSYRSVAPSSLPALLPFQRLLRNQRQNSCFQAGKAPFARHR